MDTPQKKNGTQVSKLKVEDSPVFNYINNLSPIKTVKSIPIPQTLSSLSFHSPPSVFTSPHSASLKGSLLTSNNKSYDNSKDGSEEQIETKEPEISKEECTTPRVVVNGGMDLHKMCDNVKAKSDTPDWGTLISDTTELLIYGSENESEAFRCLLQRSSNSNRRSNNEPESSDALSILHRGVRRRCLDFEMPGNNKQTFTESSSQCVVPSIGLHLNAIAMSSKDSNVGHEYSLSGNIKVGLQSSTTLRESENASQAVEETPKSLALQEPNPSSPKKKRRKSEKAGEGESSCKRCNCKKSKCLKLYCECFAAGFYCIEPCSCIDCFNKPIHKDTVLATRKQIESRNPLAFAPKVIRTTDSIIEDDASKTPASARHKRGCNCKKSGCLKKYCECYQGGVGCSVNCRCEGCKNSFGVKDGSLFVGTDDENETSDKLGTTTKPELFNPVPPSTPMPFRQPLAQLPVSSNNMLLPPPPQSHHHHHLHGDAGSSSSGTYKIMRKPEISLLSHSRVDTVLEDNIENQTQSPIRTNIKALSPNSKRVSSLVPHNNGGRKLMLSIPTFPSLTPHH